MKPVEILHESLPASIDPALYFAERTLFISEYRNTRYADQVHKELLTGKSALIISNHNTRFNTLRGIMGTLIYVDPPEGLIIPMGNHICYESNPHWWTRGFDWYYRENRIQPVPIYLKRNNGQSQHDQERTEKNKKSKQMIIEELELPGRAVFDYPEGKYSRTLGEARSGLAQFARHADIVLPLTTHRIKRFGGTTPAVTFMPVLRGKELFARLHQYIPTCGHEIVSQITSDIYMTSLSLPLPEKERGRYRDFAAAASSILEGYKPQPSYPEYRIQRFAEVFYSLVQEGCFPAREV
ncbi:MAG TPA: hypothetical protein VJL83_00085 [Patescibacteria group bacterium]|nr:hypothetical protein [Patescibacteria group bacterium]